MDYNYRFDNEGEEMVDDANKIEQKKRGGKKQRQTFDEIVRHRGFMQGLNNAIFYQLKLKSYTLNDLIEFIEL